MGTWTRSASSDEAPIWWGTTPSGHAVRLERDETGRWAATVAGAARARGSSLAAALACATGLSPSAPWIEAAVATVDVRRR